MLSSLVAYVRDLDVAEDVLQDAVVAALKYWPQRGIPRHPGAWLLQTSRRKAIDRFRRDVRFREKCAELKIMLDLEQHARPAEESAMDDSIPDERLRLMFTCCHPALDEASRVALTLRTLGGLQTGEIARAFVVQEKTLAQRLVRAKRKIKAAGIPYHVPPPRQWPERVNAVLSVLYLIFNEGYAATSGPALTRADLCVEAIRLCRILVALAPQEPEAEGLLALMLLHDSRRDARTNDAGNLVTLEYQDRARWDRAKINEGVCLLQHALQSEAAGPYQIQAAISAVHAQVERYDATDWTQITLLYDRLLERQPSPIVQLNRVAALSFARGADASLPALAELEAYPTLEQYQPYHAARADIFRRAGRTEQAIAAYRRALELTHNAAEGRFLEQRLRNLTT